MTRKTLSLFDLNIVGPAFGEAFRKLDPRLMIKNPVMFVTMAGAVLTTAGIFFSSTDRGFIAHLSLVVVHRALRQLCRSRGGRRAKPRPPRCAKREPRRWRAGCGMAMKNAFQPRHWRGFLSCVESVIWSTET